MDTESKPVEIPRGRDIMAGLHEASGYLRYVLGEPVITDEQAEELVSLVGYLEDREAKLDAWYAAGKARIEKAKAAMAGSPAFKSLAEYVRAHPTKKGGKSLVTAYGEIKLRVQRGILKVYDEKLARELCPAATYEYQPAPSLKLSKDKLKTKIEADGPLTFPGADGPVVVAEIIPEIETMSITAKPSGEVEGDGLPPRLLESLTVEDAAHENPSQPAAK
jgi:hypothetical protein